MTRHPEGSNNRPDARECAKRRALSLAQGPGQPLPTAIRATLAIRAEVDAAVLGLASMAGEVLKRLYFSHAVPIFTNKKKSGPQLGEESLGSCTIKLCAQADCADRLR